MGLPSTALTTKVVDGSPYQLNHTQVLTASQALLKHIKASEGERAQKTEKKSLLANEIDGDSDDLNDIPIWLNITTKKHIVDKKRLKPSKITLPHPLLPAPTATICLITADPQRTYKDIVASPAFPSELRTRVTRVIGVEHLKKKYHQYEAQRQLYAGHDIFLADDRIITRLSTLLGKTFYKSTTKRPIPINIQGPAPRSDGKRIARSKPDSIGETKGVIEPKKLAAEIEKTFSTALVALSPSTLTSVRVGRAGWIPEDIAENVTAVTNELTARFVPQKWRGVRAVHIKGPNTAALPIWLADELWTDETDVLEDGAVEDHPTIKGSKKREVPANVGKKRKAAAAALDDAAADDSG